jgi:hypothetical protein
MWCQEIVIVTGDPHEQHHDVGQQHRNVKISHQHHHHYVTSRAHRRDTFAATWRYISSIVIVWRIERNVVILLQLRWRYISSIFIVWRPLHDVLITCVLSPAFAIREAVMCTDILGMPDYKVLPNWIRDICRNSHILVYNYAFSVWIRWSRDIP